MAYNEDDLEDFLEHNPKASTSNGGDGSRDVLALAALVAALPRLEFKFGAAHVGIAVVEVPTRGWLPSMKLAARKTWPRSRIAVLGDVKARGGSDQLTLLSEVGSGKGVVIITPSAQRYVESALNAAARLLIKVAMPKRSTLLKVAGVLVAGDVAKEFKGVPIERLDFDTFCACVVRGGTAEGSAFRASEALRRLYDLRDDSHVPSLQDAAGYGDAKQWALELLSDLQAYRKGRLPWSEVSAGAILWGQPGTGKTMFARIVAKAAQIPIVTTSVAEYFANGDGHLDAVIKRQREAFEMAATAAPSILFIDELDALPARGAGGNNENYWVPVITDFLTLLDSSMFNRRGIVVIAATNRLHVIDGAILREGRLGTHLHIAAPDDDALEKILRFHLGDDLRDVDLTNLVRAKQGATGADVLGWVRGARRSARASGRPMVIGDLSAQMNTRQVRSREDDRRVAVHEAGHAVVAVSKGIPVISVTILSQGITGGTTAFGTETRHVLTRSDLEEKVIAILAGRAAETVVFGDQPSTAAGGGEASDLAQATVRVVEWHAAMGMGAKLTWNLGAMGSLDLATREAVENDLQRLYRAAIECVRENLGAVEAVAEALIARQTLDAEELLSLVRDAPTEPGKL